MIPLPGESVGGSIAVASVVIDDHVDPSQYMVLLLNPGVPHYSVADVDSNGVQTGAETFLNIVPAVEYYIENGGDY